MIRKLEYVSEHLRVLRRKLAEYRHGGIMLPSGEVEGIVSHLDEAIAIALNLEAEVSNVEWNRRAADDLARLMTPATVLVLDAFREGGNIVAFPRPPHSDPTDTRNE